jgi:hypothetical protein
MGREKRLDKVLKSLERIEGRVARFPCGFRIKVHCGMTELLKAPILRRKIV